MFKVIGSRCWSRRYIHYLAQWRKSENSNLKIMKVNVKRWWSRLFESHIQHSVWYVGHLEVTYNILFDMFCRLFRSHIQHSIWYVNCLEATSNILFYMLCRLFSSHSQHSVWYVGCLELTSNNLSGILCRLVSNHSHHP